jgi:hypothetical protein
VPALLARPVFHDRGHRCILRREAQTSAIGAHYQRCCVFTLEASSQALSGRWDVAGRGKRGMCLRTLFRALVCIPGDRCPSQLDITPLMMCCYNDDVDMAEYLVAQGATFTVLKDYCRVPVSSHTL